MKWRYAAWLPLILTVAALASCAEGGSRGSGISTAIRGNVQRVQSASLLRSQAASPGLLARVRDIWDIDATAHARSPVEGIAVVIEGTDIRGQTDANGDFSVR